MGCRPQATEPISLSPGTAPVSSRPYSRTFSVDGPLICGLCSQCCRGPLRTPVLLNPKTELEKYPCVSIKMQSGRTFHFLASNDNTDCIYISARGCTIYSTRPEGCRNFDCRDHVNEPRLPERMRVEGLKRIPVISGQTRGSVRGKRSAVESVL